MSQVRNELSPLTTGVMDLSGPYEGGKNQVVLVYCNVWRTCSGVSIYGGLGVNVTLKLSNHNQAL